MVRKETTIRMICTLRYDQHSVLVNGLDINDPKTDPIRP